MLDLLKGRRVSSNFLPQSTLLPFPGNTYPIYSQQNSVYSSYSKSSKTYPVTQKLNPNTSVTTNTVSLPYNYDPDKHGSISSRYTISVSSRPENPISVQTKFPLETILPRPSSGKNSTESSQSMTGNPTASSNDEQSNDTTITTGQIVQDGSKITKVIENVIENVTEKNMEIKPDQIDMVQICDDDVESPLVVDEDPVESESASSEPPLKKKRLRRVRCPRCGNLFSSLFIKKHLIEHDLKVPVFEVCYICNQSIRNIEMQDHMRDVHKRPFLTCKLCNKILFRKSPHVCEVKSG
jgi:hypothetical protein